MKQPPYLKKDDVIGLIAPAKNFEASALKNGIDILEGCGLKVKLGENIFNQYGPFAGTDEERTSDLQTMLDDDEIKAIFSIRGGYGCNRIIDSINWDKFLQSPKWIVGFSDITLLHCTLHRNGIESIHGIMPLQFGQEGTQLSVDNLRKVLFGEAVEYSISPNKLNRHGTAQGEIIGGNLAILCSAIGTPSDFDTKGKILFIEDVGEYLYRLDRMMVQMRRANKLSNLSGLIVGHLSDMLDNTVPFVMEAKEIVYDAVEDYQYPICFNFPVGHERANYPMIIGRQGLLQIDNAGTKFSYTDHSL
ncbi:MAG TPA: LD-carboxypeptidase [Cytophagaceae bacterium]|jgi:muramoyltetrapeptide carboxypeptidase